MSGQTTVTIDGNRRLGAAMVRLRKLASQSAKRNIYVETHSDRCIRKNDYMTEYIRTHPEYRAKAVEYSRENYITMNGKKVRAPNKRPRTEVCELCGRNSRKLDYHHWNDSDFSKGLWLCHLCHAFAEGADKGMMNTYLQLKGALGGFQL